MRGLHAGLRGIRYLPFGNVRAFSIGMNIEENNWEEKEWQKICALVSKETDPNRLCHLLEQLIKALDARKQELHQSEKRPLPASVTLNRKNQAL
jgi:hypothetical protein